MIVNGYNKGRIKRCVDEPEQVSLCAFSCVSLARLEIDMMQRFDLGRISILEVSDVATTIQKKSFVQICRIHERVKCTLVVWVWSAKIAYLSIEAFVLTPISHYQWFDRIIIGARSWPMYSDRTLESVCVLYRVMTMIP